MVNNIPPQAPLRAGRYARLTLQSSAPLIGTPWGAFFQKLAFLGVWLVAWPAFVYIVFRKICPDKRLSIPSGVALGIFFSVFLMLEPQKHLPVRLLAYLPRTMVHNKMGYYLRSCHDGSVSKQRAISKCVQGVVFGLALSESMIGQWRMGAQLHETCTEVCSHIRKKSAFNVTTTVCREAGWINDKGDDQVNAGLDLQDWLQKDEHWLKNDMLLSNDHHFAYDANIGISSDAQFCHGWDASNWWAGYHCSHSEAISQGINLCYQIGTLSSRHGSEQRKLKRHKMFRLNTLDTLQDFVQLSRAAERPQSLFFQLLIIMMLLSCMVVTRQKRDEVFFVKARLFGKSLILKVAVRGFLKKTQAWEDESLTQMRERETTIGKQICKRIREYEESFNGNENTVSPAKHFLMRLFENRPMEAGDAPGPIEEELRSTPRFLSTLRRSTIVTIDELDGDLGNPMKILDGDAQAKSASETKTGFCSKFPKQLCLISYGVTKVVALYACRCTHLFQGKLASAIPMNGGATGFLGCRTNSWTTPMFCISIIVFATCTLLMKILVDTWLELDACIQQVLAFDKLWQFPPMYELSRKHVQLHMEDTEDENEQEEGLSKGFPFVDFDLCPENIGYFIRLWWHWREHLVLAMVEDKVKVEIIIIIAGFWFMSSLGLVLYDVWLSGGIRVFMAHSVGKTTVQVVAAVDFLFVGGMIVLLLQRSVEVNDLFNRNFQKLQTLQIPHIDQLTYHKGRHVVAETTGDDTKAIIELCTQELQRVKTEAGDKAEGALALFGIVLSPNKVAAMVSSVVGIAGLQIFAVFKEAMD